MTAFRIRRDRLLNSIVTLSRIGRQPNGGITRTTFSDADLKARNYVCRLMRDAGLEVRMDPFANIIGRLKSSANSQVVICGSHIDTVLNGGPLDGAYGVLAGIEAARRISEEGIRPRVGLEVVAFTEEEGMRFPGFLGSLGFTGALSKQKIYAFKDENGTSFKEAMLHAGLDCDRLPAAHVNKREVEAYLELHIEQGPILEAERVRIGVVESIVGLGELMVQVAGAPGHAGTTPMPLRRDALAGAAHIILGVNHIARGKANSVATVGALAVSPNASNVIPGKVTIAVEFRNHTRSGLNDIRNEIVSLTRQVGKKANLRVTVQNKTNLGPASMSPKIIHAITSAAETLRLSHKIMRSGAAHDCQNMAKITKTGMIFVPSRDGLSHSPHESSNPEDLEAGANVLLGTILQLVDSRN